MKLIFSILLCLGSFINLNVSEIRKIYTNGVNSENVSKELALKLSNVTKDNDKTLVAYKGASIILLSKFTRKTADKINNFKEGAKLIEFALSSEPKNIEIRFIRLSIQENVPKIVKYNKSIKEDKDFILAHYNEQTNVLKEYLKKFIQQSKSFSITEKQIIK